MVHQVKLDKVFLDIPILFYAAYKYGGTFYITRCGK